MQERENCFALGGLERLALDGLEGLAFGGLEGSARTRMTPGTRTRDSLSTGSSDSRCPGAILLLHFDSTPALLSRLVLLRRPALLGLPLL